MHRSYAAVAESIPAARDDVRGALEDLTPGVDPGDLLVAVSEAVTNAVRHSGARRFDVEVGVDPDGITITVRDDGRNAWDADESMPSPAARGGRGLPLIHLLVDRADIDSGPDGTSVTLRRLLVS